MPIRHYSYGDRHPDLHIIQSAMSGDDGAKSAAILAKDGADVKMHSDQKHALTNEQ
ncbi:MAG: hypothetical protein WC750_02895 [Patescibacteria group bacterium]|jgi:hypothetical protein